MILSINWYDWVTPTTPTAAIITGSVFAILIAFMVWFEDKDWKVFFAFAGIGIGVTLLGAGLLEFLGWFN
ncbi:hypothetical protein E3U55_06330 [Filobacillus milosensis]|uniref:Uncharacterized protein n=1 Tax=Filobacillus milosensis TaxID=94137 RepID=A0A4Y8IND8_9BACI|nr:hypothetical protein [Filobacillus milosensis]TFB22851.1 hypothetical protein E3U55_06330 [Filobacillus milosensis]